MKCPRDQKSTCDYVPLFDTGMAGSNSARGMYEQFHTTKQCFGSYLSLCQRKKRPAFYGTKKFNNVHTTIRYLTLSSSSAYYYYYTPPPPPVASRSKKDKCLLVAFLLIHIRRYLPPNNNANLSCVILYIIFTASLGSLMV
jgi:hypothetical protein